MKAVKFIGWVVLFLVVVTALMFATGIINFGYQKVFKPAYENLDREVYENTQSYVHGKIQDLAKYKREYDAAKDNPIERKAIEAIINQQFSQFDSKKIQDDNLRNFLIRVRGF